MKNFEWSKEVHEVCEALRSLQPELRAAADALSRARDRMANAMPEGGADAIRAARAAERRFKQIDSRFSGLRRNLIDGVDRDLAAMLGGMIGSFQFFADNGAPVTGSTPLIRIEDARVNSAALSESVRHLGDLLSLRNIREEMESATYQNRLATAFDMVREAGAAYAQDLGDSRDEGSGCLAVLDRHAGLLAGLRTSLSQISTSDLHEEIRAIGQRAQVLRRLKHLAMWHRARADESLLAFCGDQNRRYVRACTKDIARRAEGRVKMSVLILAAAASAAALTDRAIAFAGTFSHMTHRGAVVAAVFAAMLGISILAGMICRQWRAGRLRNVVLQRLRAIFAVAEAPKRKSPGARWIEPMRTCADALVRRAGDSGLATALRRLVAGEDRPVFDTVKLSRFDTVPASIPDAGTVLERFGADNPLAMVFARAGVVTAAVATIVVAPTLILLPQVLADGRAPARDSTSLVRQHVDGTRCESTRGRIVRAPDTALAIARRDEVANAAVRTRHGSPAMQARSAARIERISGFLPEWHATWIGRASNARYALATSGPEPVPRCDEHAAVKPQPPALSNVLSLFGASGPEIPADHQPSAAGPTTAGGPSRDADAIGRTAPPQVLVLPALRMETAPGGRAVLWNLAVFIDGIPVSDLWPQLAARNAMLLPVFRAPVRSLAAISPEAAYLHGRHSLDVDRPDGKASGALLDLAFRPLRSCLMDGGTLDLDVVGFANEAWETPREPSRDLLNLNLAEGRRAALLHRLGRAIDDPALAARVRIRHPDDDSWTPLTGVLAADRRVQPRFGSYESLRQELAGWADGKETGRISGDLQEVLGRAGLVRVHAVRGGPCAAPDGPATPAPSGDAALKMKG